MQQVLLISNEELEHLSSSRSRSEEPFFEGFLPKQKGMEINRSELSVTKPATNGTMFH